MKRMPAAEKAAGNQRRRPGSPAGVLTSCSATSSRARPGPVAEILPVPAPGVTEICRIVIICDEFSLHLRTAETNRSNLVEGSG
jgi:hypothetical protein